MFEKPSHGPGPCEDVTKDSFATVANLAKDLLKKQQKSVLGSYVVHCRSSNLVVRAVRIHRTDPPRPIVPAPISLSNPGPLVRSFGS